MSKHDKNIILFVSFNAAMGRIPEHLHKTYGKQFRIALLYQNKPKSDKAKQALEKYDITIRCNFDSQKSITEALLPYQHELLAITARGESNIPALQNTIPHVPYLKTPTVESLTWATEKLKMRRRFTLFDRSLAPHYKVISDTKKKTIKEVEQKVGFPMVIKPTGLFQSLLVTIAYHPDELEDSLKRVFRKINKLQKEKNSHATPSVLVEQFMEGEMYSVDGYVNSRGKVHFTPFCHIKTGRDVGYDDFFAYQTITPTKLNKQNIENAKEQSTQAIHALGLRSTTVHIELMKTEDGWKIIEVGPRVGGFRDTMYRLSYNIDHTANDFRIRIPREPQIPRTVQGHTAVLKIFAHKEGRITKIAGIKKAQELTSFHDITEHKKTGDRAVFAKHGGDSIFNITFFNKDRSRLLADIRRFEKMLQINVS